MRAFFYKFIGRAKSQNRTATKGTFHGTGTEDGKNTAYKTTREAENRLFESIGEYFIFPNRLNGRKHRTRQAVWKDLRRVSKLFKLRGTVAPHSLRKTYARTLLREGFTLSQIQKALNHTDTTVTALYAFADELGLRE